MKTYKISKALEKALQQKIETKDKKPYNEELNKLKASLLKLDYESEYKIYYCLLNRFAKNNDYYNFLFNEFLKSRNCKIAEKCGELVSLIWYIAKEALDIKEGYRLLKNELELEVGIKKTTQRRQFLEDCKKATSRVTVYLKIEKQFTPYEDLSLQTEDKYTALEREDLKILEAYLQKVLTKKQYCYLEGYLKGKYSFSRSGKMSKALISKLKNDTLLKYLKCN